ncbi:MAG: hypothetical protein A2075_14160 [Geobacteraceae bacterium GWC2_58_44]|nr:MAG: hypothetical protein A2075_14160 [Geobacteraceae bacterium GWC2_58_44]
MKKFCLSNLQYLLLAVLAMAMTGCGASNLGNVSDGSGAATGSVASKLVWADGKSSAKTAAAAPAGVTEIKVTVTGADNSGKALPVVRGTIDPETDQGTIGGIYPGKVTLSVKAFNGSTLKYEGFAIGVVVNSGATTTIAAPIVMSPPVEKTQDKPCLQCHETTLDATGQNLIAEFKQSGHYTNSAWTDNAANGITGTGCAGCHGPSHNDTNPAASGRCAACHTATVTGNNHATNYLFDGTQVVTTTCATCHNSHNPFGPFVGGSCVACHAFAQDKTSRGNYVNDNNGVRAITMEFAKRSHHVTGRDVKDSDCAACHLEGKRVGSAVVVDMKFHMADDKIYLRNGNAALVGNQTTATGAGYAWQPSNPNHTLMDQFCFSCHNAAGAPDAAAALAGVAGYTGTALNPFGDSVSNSYDQVSRINVVGVYEQFDTGNSSHHAVRGAKYATKNLTPAMFANISTANANHAENGVRKPIGLVRAITGTMFETGKFTATYTTLNDAVLADDNVLHCGDCHTVGQFRAADVGVKPFNNAVIGAHGSENEYMLRNSNGDDTFAKDALVCFICHKESVYSVPGQTATSGNLGAIAHNSVNNSYLDCNGSFYNTAGLTGAARLAPEEGEIDDATFQTELAAGKYAATGGGNIFGNKCLNCHNASDKKTFGGIHGNAGNASYVTYSGAKVPTGAVTTVNRKPYRFLPGLGNFRYNGGDSAEQWTVKTLSQANKQGCYTLNGTSARNGVAGVGPTKATASGTNVSPSAIANDNGILGSWGACTDHAGTSVFAGRATTRNLLRPLTY